MAKILGNYKCIDLRRDGKPQNPENRKSSYDDIFWFIFVAIQGRVNHEVRMVNWMPETLEFGRLKVPNSRFALHCSAPP